jgi:hypothetical protein
MTEYAVSHDAACATVEDGAVVLNLRTKRYYSLNETATTIWNMLEADAPVEEVVHHLVSRYDVDDGIAAHSVASLLDDLVAEGLITAASK